MSKIKSRISKFYIPIVILTLGIFYFYVNPNTFAFTPKCPFYLFTGFHCPGCGSQRAFHEILHGNLWTGLQHNFLIILAVLIVSYKIIMSFIYKSSSNKTQNLLYHNSTPWVIFGIVMLFWVLRNIPLEPFIILAP